MSHTSKRPGPSLSDMASEKPLTCFVPQFLHLKNGRVGLLALSFMGLTSGSGHRCWERDLGVSVFPRQAGLASLSLPPSLALLAEVEASADEPGAVGTALHGVLPQGPRLLVKTAEMRGSVGGLGPLGRPLSLAGVQGWGR